MAEPERVNRPGPRCEADSEDAGRGLGVDSLDSGSAPQSTDGPRDGRYVPEGGRAAYVERVRDSHRWTARYGCACGEPLCPQRLLLDHIDDLLHAHTLKVQDFAKETARVAELTRERDLWKGNWEKAQRGNTMLLDKFGAAVLLPDDWREQVRRLGNLIRGGYEYEGAMITLIESWSGRPVAQEAGEPPRVARVWQKGDPEPHCEHGIVRGMMICPVCDPARQAHAEAHARAANEDNVPPGPYAKGERSPIVWVLLCPVCAGYTPQTDEDYQGFLSGQCRGCGAHVRELHRFRAWIDSAAGCHCSGSHPQVVGDVVSERVGVIEDGDSNG